MLVHRCDANASDSHLRRKRFTPPTQTQAQWEAQHGGRSGSAGGVFRRDSWSLTYETKAPNAREHSKKTKTWMAEKSFDKGDFMKVIDKLVKEFGDREYYSYLGVQDASWRSPPIPHLMWWRFSISCVGACLAFVFTSLVWTSFLQTSSVRKLSMDGYDQFF